MTAADSGVEAREVPARTALTVQGGWKIFNVHAEDIAVLTDATRAVPDFQRTQIQHLSHSVPNSRIAQMTEQTPTKQTQI